MIRTTSIFMRTKRPITFLRASVIAGKNILYKNDKRYQNTATNIKNNDKFLKFSQTEGYTKLSPYEPITTPNIPLDKYIWEDMHKWHDKIASVCVVTGRKYTYSQLRDASGALAIRLQKNFNLQPRDVIAICLPNFPEYPIAIFGSLEAGLTITLVNPIYTADEISRQLLMSNAKLIICPAEGYDTIKNACDIAKTKIPIMCIKNSPNTNLPTNSIDFFQMIDTHRINRNDLKPHNITGEDIAFLPFSSGTTGLPKGVVLTHNNITTNCEQIQTKLPHDYLTHQTTTNFQESIPCILPFFHIYGLTVCLISKMRLGCKLVTMPKFTPEDLMKSLMVHNATLLNLVPPIILFLTNHPAVKKEYLDSVRSVMSGAAPIGSSDVERFLTKYSKATFIQGYGLTECSPVVVLTPNNNKKYSSCGYIVASTEARIISLDDNSAKGLGPNESGELCVRGNHVMPGYLNNDEANAKTFYKDNWLRTGDIAYYDDEGYFYITDRLKELIKVQGFQVPPAELEELLRNHPKIIDAAVFGIPHQKTGEVPRAVVVLKQGAQATEDEIKKFVADKVVYYKKLDGGIEFVKEIPKNAAGKILRKDLKQQYLNNK